MYEYDVFISYRRSETAGRWVRNHFAPRLEARLNEVAAHPARIFFDGQLTEGANLPAELKSKIRHSSLLLAVWSADYFRSAWCMAEWQSFRQREEKLGLFTNAQPTGLVYPVRYADGAHYHPDANVALCRRDFSELSYPDESFRNTAKYLDFDDLVRQIANDLATRLPAVPHWREDFPVVEMPPMQPVTLSCPRL